MAQLSNQLDYKKDVFMHPTYRFNKILPLSGSTNQLVSTTGGVENIFEIPVKAFNLYESFLSFQFRIPASPNPGYNNVYKDCFPHWRQVQLYTRSGIYICDLNELANYTKVTLNAETELKEFLDNDFMKGVVGGTDGPPPTLVAAATGAPGLIGAGAHFHKSGCAKDSYTGNAARPAIAGAFSAPPTYTVTATDVIHIPLLPTDAHTDFTTGTTATPAASYYNEIEPSYVYRSALEAGGAESVLNMNVMFPLKHIKNSIFSVNKDLYLGEIIIMRVVWSPSTKVVFSNTNALVLNTGALATTNTIGIFNIALYLATEKNPEITNQLMSQVASPQGLSILIPYVYTYKNALSGTSQNVSLRFNRGHGRRLLKVYHSIFNGTESAATAYDHNNINGAKCTSYYTMLNNERLQEYNLDCTQLDDYNLHRNYLKDKVLQNGNVYQYNWFHMDQFTGDNKEFSNLESGLDLSVEQKWDIYCTTANANFNHYDYAVTQKMLTVSGAGITCI